jgi:hypothetical protein
MTDNEHDIHLLNTDHHAFLMKYQKVIRINVARFVQSKYFVQSEFEDGVQSVNEQLLKRLPSIQKNYDSRSLVVTYVSVVIRNICLQVKSADRPGNVARGHVEQVEMPEDTILGSIDIALAVQKLQRVLLLFHTDRPRILLLLPLKFGLPLTSATILSAYPGCPKPMLSMLLEAVENIRDARTSAQIFELVVPFLNHMEHTTTGADAYRHWLDERIREIRALLQSALGASELSIEDVRTIVEAMWLRNRGDP